MSLQKKGVPTFDLRGCVAFEGKIFVSVQEFARLCKTFPKANGLEIARVLEQRISKESEITKTLPTATLQRSFLSRLFK